MNRRQAIGRIFFGSLGGAVLISGYEWNALTKTPDVAYVEKNKELIAALAETIIPKTDVPGATEAGVHDFIVVMIKDCTEYKAQNKFIDGLKDLQSYSKNKYGKYYQNCSDGEKQAIFGYFEKKGRPFAGIVGKVQNRFLGKNFMSTLKEYTVEGYCTSEIGATQALTYVPVPGSYKGCIRIEPGQKAWATN
jgi:hypothetical protein